MHEKAEEVWSCAKLTLDQCKTCVYSKRPAPFANHYEKAYCLVYTREDGESKPEDVKYNGAPCEFHTTEAEMEELLENEDNVRAFAIAHGYDGAEYAGR